MATAPHHDCILSVIHRDVTHCGLRSDLEPRSLFAATLPAAAIRRVGPRRLGIIPDLRIRDVPFPDRHHSGLREVEALHRARP